jgi:hypothetical protein
MKGIMNFLVTTYLGGVTCIVIGILVIWHTIRNPDTDKNAWFAGDLKGWAGGIGAIALGIVILIAKLIGKL